jgi:folate-binding protein YgfZ
MPLTHLAVIEASGADATAFLHTQLSNDVQGLPPDRSLLAGYCNAKGRLYALPRLWRSGDDWRLCLPADIADAVLKRLRLFVLRSQVTLTRRHDLTLLGVAGDGAADCLRRADLPTPEVIDAVESTGAASVLRWPGAPPRFQVCVPDDAAPACWAALAAGAQPAPATEWRLLDIDAGQPAVYAPTLEAFVPQMVNLELIGGVSFGKGCYPGQEIVARMHYLGKPSRRMFHLRAAGDPPAPGTHVVDDSGREVGNVVDAQHAPGGGCGLLAVLQVTVADRPLRLPDGAPLERVALPYALESEATTDH